MDALQLVAVLKVALWAVPLFLLLSNHRWKWLITAIIMYMGLNLATALGANRDLILFASIAAQVVLTIHVFDITKYTKPKE